MPRTPTPRKGEPIKIKPNGKYQAVVDTTPPDAWKHGGRKQVTKTFDTLPEARRFVTETRAKVARGEFQAPSNDTLRQVAERWLTSRVDVRPVTVEGYRASLQAVLRRIGDRKVQSLTRADMVSLVAWLSAQGGKPSKANPLGRALTPRAVRAAMVALGQVLDMAVHDGLVRENVSRGVKRPRVVERVGTDLEHWNPAQLLGFRDYVDDPRTDTEGRTWQPAAYRLTLSGLTRSDVLGLRWSDVDLDHGTVTVRQGRVALAASGAGTHTDAPKSAQRRRTVPVEMLHPGTVAMLKSLKAAQAADRLKVGSAYANGTTVESQYVVVNELGEPVRPEVYSDTFKRLCVAAGVPVIRLHSVRHSLAFWLHGIGVTPADAASLLGHTVEVHLSTYLPESGATGIARAAELFAADAARRAQ